jgi:hypothetical protein
MPPRIGTVFQFGFIIGWAIALILGVAAYRNYNKAEELRQGIQTLKARQPARQAPAE